MRIKSENVKIDQHTCVMLAGRQENELSLEKFGEEIRTTFMPGKVHTNTNKHTSTHSVYFDEGKSLEWGPMAGKTSDRRRNEE